MATQTATRQQLDELDALLQKMLGTPASLPDSVKAAEPRPKPVVPASNQTPPPKPPQFPVPEVAFGVPPAAAFAASSQATTTKPVAEERPAWAIDLNPKEGSSVLGNSRGAVPTPPPVAAASAMLSVTTIANPTAGESFQVPVTQSAVLNDEVPLALRPLAWLSDCCDALLSSVPFGRLLTSPSGRTLMGYVGLAMLAASLASGALAWVGWSW